ncbi:hypothetical protein ZWY2020_047380 [Hordeum vulgare]|nr:hypothetical protein ZWY2020_047380 [Hordeum vulgare]
MEDMVVPDINCTPPADEMDEAPVVEMDEDGVQKRDSLDDKRKYAAYVALHTLCMSRRDKFNTDDKKKWLTFLE